jgi:hypothetical protein
LIELESIRVIIETLPKVSLDFWEHYQSLIDLHSTRLSSSNPRKIDKDTRPEIRFMHTYDHKL